MREYSEILALISERYISDSLHQIIDEHFAAQYCGEAVLPYNKIVDVGNLRKESFAILKERLNVQTDAAIARLNRSDRDLVSFHIDLLVLQNVVQYASECENFVRRLEEG